jgi:hypothetical protein
LRLPCPACGLDDPACFATGVVELAEPGIGIGLHQSGMARQMLLGMLAAMIGRVEEHGRRRIRPGKWAIIAHIIGPKRTGRVLPLAKTGIVVSSAWMRSAAKTWLRIASTSGIRVAAEAPTQSASVDTSRSMPSRWSTAL